MELTKKQWLKNFEQELRKTKLTEKEIQEEIDAIRFDIGTMSIYTPKEWADMVTM